MMRALLRLARDNSAAAAAEMAMTLPVLMALTYAAFEMGNYFLTEHVVQKAARDAARYAARLPWTSYPSCVPTSAAEQQIRRVARSGLPTGTAANRIYTWTADNMTTVTLVCDTSGTYTGVFKDFPNGAPVITVTSTVPYGSLWGNLGFGSLNLNVYGRSQAAVFGA